MKTQIHKYTVVLVIVLLGAEGIYLLARQMGWIHGQQAAQEQAQEKVGPKKKAVLLEANLAREDELQGCYENFLRTEPKVDEGTVEVHWMLDGRGHITSMEMAHSDLVDETFTQCLLDKIRKMTFKAPPKARPTLVSHKFNFHKRSPASLDFKQASGTGNSNEE